MMSYLEKLKTLVKEENLIENKYDIKSLFESYKYDEKSLSNIIKNNISKSDCIKELGLSVTPGNYDTLNRYIEKYNIESYLFNQVGFFYLMK